MNNISNNNSNTINSNTFLKIYDPYDPQLEWMYIDTIPSELKIKQ